MRFGLTGRMVVAGSLLAILIGAAFATLLLAVANFRAATDQRRDTREEIVVAGALEKLVIDLETGLRGFVITGQRRFLEPFDAARAALPETASEFDRIASDTPLESARVRRLVDGITAYVQAYALPLLQAVRRGEAAAHSVKVTDAGTRRIDALRAGFDQFSETELADLEARESDADDAAQRALIAAGSGVTGSVILIVVFTGYLTRVIVRPLRTAALMANRIAHGDLTPRLRETDVAEIGVLERSFNVMATSLEKRTDELGTLLAEQAALRRVATLAAEGVAPTDIFSAVTEEVGRLFGADQAAVGRFEPEHSAILIVGVSQVTDELSVGMRWEFDDSLATTEVFRTGQAARRDATDRETASGLAADRVRHVGIRSTVASPIVVAGRRWGAMVVSTKNDALPPDTEKRLTSFTELIETAVANAEGSAKIAQLAEEQAALRRVATLVARGVSADQVFAGVATEIANVLSLRAVTIDRYDPDASYTVVASLNDPGFALGSRWPLDGSSLAATVLETSRPARVDDYADLQSTVAEVEREHRVNSTVGVPILVEGAVWGVICVSSYNPEPLPSDTEERLAAFTELLETAISNAHGRAEVVASRARVVAAADETRRRIERDLHDGIQQRLVSLGLELRLAQTSVPPQLGQLDDALSHVSVGLAGVFDELREISRGIHPAILSEGGLEPALDGLRRRSAVPVEVEVNGVKRLPDAVEVAAYYMVSEALTNAAKHAHASVVHVELDAPDSTLQLAIRDDGIGGADSTRGSGLVGLRDRVEALGGTFKVSSSAGGGTTLLADIPLDRDASPLVGP